MAAKTLENLYHLQMLKLSKNGKKSEIPKEKQKVMYSVALAMAFITAENENGLLEDLPKADSGHVSERFLLSVRTKSITENFEN